MDNRCQPPRSIAYCPLARPAMQLALRISGILRAEEPTARRTPLYVAIGPEHRMIAATQANMFHFLDPFRCKHSHFKTEQPSAVPSKSKKKKNISYKMSSFSSDLSPRAHSANCPRLQLDNNGDYCVFCWLETLNKPPGPRFIASFSHRRTDTGCQLLKRASGCLHPSVCLL